MSRSINAQHVLKLYKTILRLHRSLPLEMRNLGDEYVKEEFRKHKEIGIAERDVFMREWIGYSIQLSVQLGGSHGPKVGNKLTEEQIYAFRDDQLGQLYQLYEESSKPIATNDEKSNNS